MKKRVQCEKCPWKVDTDPNDIPNGYDVEKHKALKRTIAEPGSLTSAFVGGTMRAMACHDSKVGAEEVCVGWLANQLGPGNNLGLRMQLIRGKLPKFETVGEQHERFEDTLPDDADEIEGLHELEPEEEQACSRRRKR